MTGHEVDVVLRILMHTSSLRDYIAYVFVVFLYASLLIGYIRITVEYLGTLSAGLILFDIPGILEFGAVVSQDDREILFEHPDPYRVTEIVYGIDHTSLRAVREQYDDHKTATSKQQSQQAFAGGTASFDGVHFNYAQIRKGLGIFLKVNVCALVAVCLLNIPYARFRAFFSLFVPDSARQIDVTCLEDTLVQIVVQRPSAYGDLISMYCKDMAQRLAFKHERGDELVQFLQFFLGHVDTFPGLYECFFILHLSMLCLIKEMSGMAAFFLWTSVTDIRGMI